jgi:hypothetical protein
MTAGPCLMHASPSSTAACPANCRAAAVYWFLSNHFWMPAWVSSLMPLALPVWALLQGTRKSTQFVPRHQQHMQQSKGQQDSNNARLIVAVSTHKSTQFVTQHTTSAPGLAHLDFAARTGSMAQPCLREGRLTHSASGTSSTSQMSPRTRQPARTYAQGKCLVHAAPQAFRYLDRECDEFSGPCFSQCPDSEIQNPTALTQPQTQSNP